MGAAEPPDPICAHPRLLSHRSFVCCHSTLLSLRVLVSCSSRAQTFPFPSGFGYGAPGAQHIAVGLTFLYLLQVGSARYHGALIYFNAEFHT